jgi:hypothetical protein
MLYQIGNGELPIFDTISERYYVFDMNQENPERSLWNIFTNHTHHRIVVQDTIDCPFDLFERALPHWIGNSPITDEDGTLMFVLRSIHELDGISYILAGISFVHNLDVIAEPINNATERILEFCRDPLHRTEEHQIVTNSRSRCRELEQEQEKALVRSRLLLESCLSEAQRQELHTTGSFSLVARDGKTYKVSQTYSHSVALLEKGTPVTEYCVVPKVSLPIYDRMLAQKLMLEGSIEEFFQLANVRQVNRVERIGIDLVGDLQDIYINTQNIDRLQMLETARNRFRRAG